ncbi:hypothetical protein BKA00_005559 [Actinomadura coerulea]|uniref:Uncharacterized protein n=1 Tax=Actinomadura coerulea TaxID=46159 RepID=A0A7X0G384_9ACTN|nr:hypothetical protein [Actinomadura coerulea]MBB6398645.1 hypothetical protein [Actinomadura coerulea]GGQ00394.1 hypothetical protein GCM10010187_15200 [Actinomadura coerulea]
MSDDVQQVQPLDSGIAEEWLRKTDDPDLRAVSASKLRAAPLWSVSVWVMEFVRTDPLESELRRRIADALSAVDGVTSVEEEDREVWTVTGTPTGRALVEAVAQVVDAMAPQSFDHTALDSES